MPDSLSIYVISVSGISNGGGVPKYQPGTKMMRRSVTVRFPPPVCRKRKGMFAWREGNANSTLSSLDNSTVIVAPALSDRLHRLTGCGGHHSGFRGLFYVGATLKAKIFFG